MRPIALSRKNALFGGQDAGAANWACIASLIETAKLNGVDPQAWLADTLEKLVNLWPAARIDELLPWAYSRTVVAQKHRLQSYCCAVCCMLHLHDGGDSHTVTIGIASVIQRRRGRDRGTGHTPWRHDRLRERGRIQA
jgi:hypothetical protein